MSASTDAMRMRQIEIDGERLHVDFSPGEGTPLILCNDFVANLDILDDFVVALDRPTVRFDLPGIGASAEVHRMRRMRALSTLLSGLLDELGLVEQAVDVMGIGWGGLLAQQFARDHRRRVRRLVLAATSNGQVMFPGRFASLWRLARPGGLVDTAPDADRARRLFGGRRNDECEAIAEAMRRAVAPTRRGYAAQFYALTGYSSLGWLHRLTVPTLVVAGDDDSVMPAVNARVLALMLPQARLEIVRGGGHWFVLERSSEIARLLADFLDAAVPVAQADQDNTL